jgi:peroxiredoxin
VRRKRSGSDVGHDPQSTRRLRDWLINGVLILLVFLGVQWWKARPLVEGDAPPLAGFTLDGRALDLADLQGRPVLVHFWASWCPMCDLMDGAIDSIARDHPVVTVAMQSGDPDELRRFMSEAGHTYPVIADPAGQIASRWGVVGVPTSFVVDATGQIRSSTTGVSTEPGLRLRLWIADQASPEPEPAATRIGEALLASRGSLSAMMSSNLIENADF